MRYCRQAHEGGEIQHLSQRDWEIAAACNVYDIYIAIDHGFDSPGCHYWTEQD